jgi:transposase-like protein
METKRVARRKHSAELKAEVVQACRQPQASVAAIALRNGLNANVVYRWLSQDAQKLELSGANRLTVRSRSVGEFVPVQLAQPVPTASSPDIRMELRRGASSVTVSWPTQYAGECGAWLREWLR